MFWGEKRGFVVIFVLSAKGLDFRNPMEGGPSGGRRHGELPQLFPLSQTSHSPLPRVLSRNYKSEVMVPVKAGGGSHCRAGQTGVCLIM